MTFSTRRVDAQRLMLPGGGRRAMTSVVRAPVMVKAAPEAPAQPMPGARVRLYRMRDGRHVWSGYSDALGEYHARRLERGIRFVPVAIDLTGAYECVAAGPVTSSTAPRIVDALVVARIGDALRHPLNIVGATGAAITHLKSGTLPDGVSYSVRHGFVAGSVAGPTGDYPVVMEIADEAGVVEQEVVVRSELLPLRILTQFPATLEVDAEVDPIILAATGGEGPYTWSVTGGDLPDGLALQDPSESVSGEWAIVGAPDTAGEYTFTVTATGAQGAASAQVTIAALTPAKYWRLVGRGGAAYIRIGEILFDDAQATGGTASASSEYSGSYPASAAFNGTADAGWCSASGQGNGGWVQYEFSAARLVSSVSIMAPNGNWIYCPTDFDLESSVDGATWDLRLSVRGAPAWGYPETRRYALWPH